MLDLLVYNHPYTLPILIVASILVVTKLIIETRKDI